MASQTSDPENARWAGPRVKHADIAAKLSATRSKLAGTEAPRNAGNRRTPSKRALLTAIEDAGGKW